MRWTCLRRREPRRPSGLPLVLVLREVGFRSHSGGAFAGAWWLVGHWRGFHGCWVSGWGLWQVLGLAVGFGAGVPGSCVRGRGHCRVAAFRLSGLLVLAILFITISHCAWRHVISLSKATKKRSKENAFRTRARKLT